MIRRTAPPTDDKPNLDERAGEPMVSVTVDDTRLTLLGTAHVSRASADAVRTLLAGGGYDAVAIELCPSRYRALLAPDALARMDLFRVLRERKAAMVTASLALAAYQQRLAEQFGIEPGAEMRAAVDSARAAGLPVLLIDREINVTLKRLYRGVPWWVRANLLAGLLMGVVSREHISEADIERLKQGDILESTFTQFAEHSPALYRPLIDERDRYMAARLREEAAHGKYARILAVVGAGHLRGIDRYLREGTSEPRAVIAELDRMPPPKRWPRAIPWAIVALVLVGFGYGFRHSPALGWQMVFDWVLINGGLSALGAALAGGHPLTIAGAFLAAPLTSLNPTVGAGMVTAAIEIFMRKPTVGDFSRLRRETTRVRGWWRNRVTRVLLVFVLSTLGSAIGTYVAGFRILDRLTQV